MLRNKNDDTSSLIREKVDLVRQNTSNIHFEIHKIQQRVNLVAAPSEKSQISNKPQQDQGGHSKPSLRRPPAPSEDDEEPDVPV